MSKICQRITLSELYVKRKGANSYSSDCTSRTGVIEIFHAHRILKHPKRKLNFAKPSCLFFKDMG
jgi:hypothetical protein